MLLEDVLKCFYRPASLVISLLSVLCFSLPVSAGAAEVDYNAPDLFAFLPLKEYQGHLRFTFDAVDMPDGRKDMGLAGINYLVDLKKNYYLGLGVYESLTGEYGGFFTGGIEAGGRIYAIEPVALDAGVFVGGGGGGGAPQGGGLMVRPHAGLVWYFDTWRLGLNYSWVKFPDGEIDSHNASLAVEIPLDFHLVPGRASRDSFDTLTPELRRRLPYSRQELTLVGRSYSPRKNTRDTSGALSEDSIDMVGFEYRGSLGTNLFYLVETQGAFNGDADGFAELLLGVGYRLPLGRTELAATLSAGGAGGGQVDTGGGAVVRGELSAGYGLTPALKLGVSGGYIDAVDGSFSALSLGSRLSMAFDTPNPQGGMFSGFRDDELDFSQWRVRINHQSYAKPARKQGSDDVAVHLAGAKLDHFLSENLFLTGQAAGAYKGEAGGYATGLVGAGYEVKLFGLDECLLDAELLLGAGGGGGLSVGGGGVVQPMMGLLYKPFPAFSVQLSGGYVKSFEGDLNSPVFDLSFNYSYETLERTIRWPGSK